MNSILLVDDDDLLRESLGELLRQEGFQVVAVHDGSTAIQVGKGKDRWLALITDFSMGELSGADVIRHFKNSPIQFKKKILLTAHAPDTPEISALLKDFTVSYVAKPFNLGDLLKLMRES